MTLPAPSAIDRAESRLGRTIREKYLLERVLGVGGMATVYLATHRNGSRAAVKILHPELAVIDVHRERFVREAYVANSINHSGAVRVVDDDVAEDNCPFLVMELLEGETLEARRRRLGRLDPREVLAMSHTLCDTLAAAHVAGVVHRDIKPENLFLTKAGALKILDFGIARVRHEGGVSGTRTGVMMGTPAFMPPEQALGRRTEIDARTDLWAAGATMFTLLSGRFVHEADSPEEMMVRAATQPPRSLLEVFPDAPLPIAEIVDKALAFKRENRFQSAEAMRDAIADVHLEVFGASIETTTMPLAPSSLPASSLRLPRNNSAEILTMPAEDAAKDDAAPTVADRPFRGDDAPTMADISGVHPTIAAPSAATRIEGAPQTRRSNEPAPLPTRPNRSRLAVFGIAALAAAVFVFVGIRHVKGRPVEKAPEVHVCKRHAECASGERCDEKGQCAPANGCVTNAACVAELGDKPAICRQDTGKCVALETPHCRVFAEKADLQNDDTIWVGAMYPESDKSMDYGPEAMRTIDLARRDFVGLTGGLPPIEAGGRPRPLAIVACDDAVDYDKSAEHLVNVVKVPAILGFGRSKEVLDLASRYFIPKGILALASNTASMLSSISHQPDQPRMVFRVTTYAEMSARMEAAIIRDVIEKELRKPNGLVRATEPLRIAFLQSENASGTSHTDAMLGKFGAGAGAKEHPPEDVRSFIFADSMGRTFADQDSTTIDSVVKFAPHIIIDSGASHTAFLAVEKRWPANSRYRPYYLIGGSLTSGPTNELAESNPSVPSRLFGISPATGGAAGRKFEMHYKGTFTDTAESEGLNPAPYDAFYLFAYATMSLGSTPLTGTNLARAVKRLMPPGEKIEVGPAGILPVFKALAAGQNIDLDGAMTSLDFDMNTGDAEVDLEANCFDRKTRKSVSSSLFFRARAGRLEGAWKCP